MVTLSVLMDQMKRPAATDCRILYFSVRSVQSVFQQRQCVMAYSTAQTGRTKPLLRALQDVVLKLYKIHLLRDCLLYTSRCV